MEDSEIRRWHRRRILYDTGRLIFIVLCGFYIGPNLLLFGRLSPVSPDELAQTVQRVCMPIVVAIKEYQRDTGEAPNSIQDLNPKYLVSAPAGMDISGGNYVDWDVHGSVVVYNFPPSREGWEVTGPTINGALPLPIVTIEPTTQPITPAQ